MDRLFLACSVSQESSALIVACVSCLVMIFQATFAWRTERQRKEDDLKRRLEHILEMTLEYPYLEHRKFTEGWKENRHSDDERYIRYDQFCTVLFNFLEDVHRFYMGDKESIEAFVDVESWVRLHRQNWLNPVEENENINGYKTDFREFIHHYMREEER